MKITNPVLKYIKIPKIIKKRPDIKRIIIKSLINFILCLLAYIIAILLPTTLHSILGCFFLFSTISIIFITPSNQKHSQLFSLLLSLSIGSLFGSIDSYYELLIPGIVLSIALSNYLSALACLSFLKKSHKVTFKKKLFLSILVMIIMNLIILIISLINRKYLNFIYFKGFPFLMIISLFIWPQVIIYANFNQQIEELSRISDRSNEDFLVYAQVISILTIYYQIMYILINWITIFLERGKNEKSHKKR